uniref:DnaB-like helicase C-terminal domain-containing protein n=1 Tax=Streptomyces scabiei TaxID=1930 RepID=UPI000E699794|nr:DnaB-like helicase C-terminal domain-containing protein [Streptomyces scabiei]
MTNDIATAPGLNAAEAEKILAASVMARPDLIDELADEFSSDDFEFPRNLWVWKAVDEIRQSLTDGEIRWQAVGRQLQAWKASGELPMVPPSVSDLAVLYDSAEPSYSAAAYYAQQVTEAAVARRLYAVGHDAAVRARSAAFNPVEDIPAIQAALDGVLSSNVSSDTVLAADLLGAALARAVTPPTLADRIPTGIVDLDAVTGGGFAPGRMVIVGARPGAGKTTFGLGLARAAAIRAKIPTLFCTLEMGGDEVMNTILAADARVPLHHITTGKVDDLGVARMLKSAERIKTAPLHIDDATQVTLASLRGKVRHLIRTVGLRLLVVDYLQLMQAPKAENRQVAVSALSRGLKLLAKEFGITVIVLAQLNRASEQRADKRPTIADLRESGSIEQDADIVILLHRPDMYEPESPRAGEIDLILDKHRAGSRTTITAAFQGHYGAVVDMAQT